MEFNRENRLMVISYACESIDRGMRVHADDVKELMEALIEFHIDPNQGTLSKLYSYAGLVAENVDCMRS